MFNLYMTAYGGSILGPIASFFGFIMNAIYNFFEKVIGVENVNIGLIIIIFTIVVYIFLLPLTYQQQKFSNLQRKISPELKAIQNKYKGKKDQASMMKQQEETQALYDKYGISMSGSCVQMLIQLPILYALYGVFNNLPAYIESVRNIFTDLVTKIQADPGYQSKMDALYQSMDSRRIRVDFFAEGASDEQLGNYVIDVLYKLSESGWNTLSDTFPKLSDIISLAHNNLQDINYFFILNISDTPLNLIKSGWGERAYGLVFAALLIPVFSYLSQVLNLKFAQISQPGVNDQAAQQMQTMNRIMPLISLIFVFSVPIGLGLYWITGALFRSLCQFILNKRFQRMDLDAIIEKNKERAEKRKKKREKRNESIANSATMRTKTMSQKANIKNAADASLTETEGESVVKYKEGSMASKANLVSDYNNRNTRK